MCGWLLAAAVALGLLIPTLDIFRCIGGDAPSNFQKEVTLALEDADGLPDTAPIHGDGDALCVHGHCHHWTGDTKLAERPLFRMALDFSTPSFGNGNTFTSAPQSGLLRPPRA